MSTKIEWTHYVTADGKMIKGATLNPIKGCSHAGYQPVDGGPKRAHSGCERCYAERFCQRNMHGEKASGVADWNGTIDFYPERLAWPFTKPGFKARRDGYKTIVFLCSESDMGHPNVPDDAWKAINGMMLLATHIIWKDFTKRPEIQRERLERWSPWECVQAVNRVAHVSIAPFIGTDITSIRRGWFDFPHIHRYVSVSDQPTADALIPELLAMPAAVRGVSYEPAISNIVWQQCVESGRIDHIIAGCESGHSARHFNEQWMRNTRDWCIANSVPFFYKQGRRGREVISTPELDERQWVEHVSISNAQNAR